MNENIEVEVLLLPYNELNLLVDEVLVLLSGNLTLSELLAGNTNLLSLGERSDSGSREKRKTEVSLLASDTSLEGRETVVHLRGDLGLALLDSRVVGAGRCGTSVHGSGIGIELSTDGLRAIGNSFCNDSNLLSFLGSKSKPVGNLSGKLLLGGKSVGGMEKGRGGSNDNTVSAKSLDCLLNNSNGLLVVCLPDVTSINDTGREGLTRGKSTNNSVKLLRVADKVNVDSGDGGNAREDIDVVDNVTEVGSQGDGRDVSFRSSEGLIGRLESILGLLGQVQDEDRFINLDGIGASSLELLQEFNVDRDELGKKRDGVNRLATIRLSKVEERDRADKDRASDNSLLLCLEELTNGLGVGGECESLVVLEGRADVVVV